MVILAGGTIAQVHPHINKRSKETRPHVHIYMNAGKGGGQPLAAVLRVRSLIYVRYVGWLVVAVNAFEVGAGACLQC